MGGPARNAGEQTMTQTNADSQILNTRFSFDSSLTVGHRFLDVTQQLRQGKNELINITRQLETEKLELNTRNTQLLETNRVYKVKLDATQRIIEQMQFSTPRRDQLMRQFQFDPSLLQTNRPFNQ